MFNLDEYCNMIIVLGGLRESMLEVTSSGNDKIVTLLSAC